MGKYRKKPVVIEAFQMTKLRRWDNSEWPDWLLAAWQKTNDEVGSLFPDPNEPYAPGHESAAELAIYTLEGTYKVGWDDYIIKGEQGELYPCQALKFNQTYDKVIGEAVGAVVQGENDDLWGEAIADETRPGIYNESQFMAK